MRQPLQPHQHAETYEGHNIKFETLVMCWVGEACKQNVVFFLIHIPDFSSVYHIYTQQHVKCNP